VSLSSAQILSRATRGDVREYGAVTGVDCTAAVTAAAALNFEVEFPSGAWVISSTPTIPTGVIITCLPGSTFSGAGASVLGLGVSSTAGRQTSEYAPSGGGELATYNIFRNPSAAGGTPGNVSNGLRVQVNVGASVAQYEWAILGVLNNKATAGENVAGYFQANKGTLGVAAGPTWGAVTEAHDKSGLSDPVSGLVSLECHISSDGTDVNTRRIGIDVVGDIGVSAGGDISYGIRIGAFNGVDANCLFYNGIYLRNKHTRAINISSTGAVGIDISGATLTAAAIRLATDQYISFVNTDTKRLRWNAGASGLVYQSGGTDKFHLRDTGGIRCSVDAGIPASGSTTMSVTFSSAGDFGIFVGSGSPSGALTALKGSLYLRSNGTGTNDRAYINTDGGTTWTAIVTVA